MYRQMETIAISPVLTQSVKIVLYFTVTKCNTLGSVHVLLSCSWHVNLSRLKLMQTMLHIMCRNHWRIFVWWQVGYLSLTCGIDLRVLLPYHADQSDITQRRFQIPSLTSKTQLHLTRFTAHLKQVLTPEFTKITTTQKLSNTTPIKTVRTASDRKVSSVWHVYIGKTVMPATNHRQALFALLPSKTAVAMWRIDWLS